MTPTAGGAGGGGFMASNEVTQDAIVPAPLAAPLDSPPAAAASEDAEAGGDLGASSSEEGSSSAGGEGLLGQATAMGSDLFSTAQSSFSQLAAKVATAPNSLMHGAGAVLAYMRTAVAASK